MAFLTSATHQSDCVENLPHIPAPGSNRSQLFGPKLDCLRQEEGGNGGPMRSEGSGGC